MARILERMTILIFQKSAKLLRQQGNLKEAEAFEELARRMRGQNVVDSHGRDVRRLAELSRNPVSRNEVSQP